MESFPNICIYSSYSLGPFIKPFHIQIIIHQITATQPCYQPDSFMVSTVKCYVRVMWWAKFIVSSCGPRRWAEKEANSLFLWTFIVSVHVWLWRGRDLSYQVLFFHNNGLHSEHPGEGWTVLATGTVPTKAKTVNQGYCRANSCTVGRMN